MLYSILRYQKSTNCHKISSKKCRFYYQKLPPDESNMYVALRNRNIYIEAIYSVFLKTEWIHLIDTSINIFLLQHIYKKEAIYSLYASKSMQQRSGRLLPPILFYWLLLCGYGGFYIWGGTTQRVYLISVRQTPGSRVFVCVCVCVVVSIINICKKKPNRIQQRNIKSRRFAVSHSRCIPFWYNPLWKARQLSS